MSFVLVAICISPKFPKYLMPYLFYVEKDVFVIKSFYFATSEHLFSSILLSDYIFSKTIILPISLCFLSYVPQKWMQSRTMRKEKL